MIFFSSDHHFWHTNVIKYCSRPYDSVEAMNDDLIARWNAAVSPDDTVYYLGDFSLSVRALPIVGKLNGTKILVPGNHDHAFPWNGKPARKAVRYLDAGFSEIVTEPREWTLEGLPEPVVLWHLPRASDNSDSRYLEYRPPQSDAWLLCGHVHEKWKIRDRMINVGVDVWNYTPVSAATIAAVMGGLR